jgi:hypothetical protein
VPFDPTLRLPHGSVETDYTLTAVVHHRGDETASGHYTASVRTAAGGWYAVDDGKVAPTAWPEVAREEASVLVYVRGTPPGAPRPAASGSSAPVPLPGPAAVPAARDGDGWEVVASRKGHSGADMGAAGGASSPPLNFYADMQKF